MISIHIQIPEKVNFALAIAIFISFIAQAQNGRDHFKKGNEAYKQKNYNDAEINYRKGLEKTPESLVGAYNLANALYQQEKYSEAREILDKLMQKENLSGKIKSDIYHNLGNSLLQEKNYKPAIEAYKESLKNYPDGEDSRYNLSYAMRMLQQQQQQQNQNNEKQKEQSSQQQQQDQAKNDEQKKEKQQKQENKGTITREEAERMLDAMMRQEKSLHEKANRKSKPGNAKSEKDW